MQQSTWLFKFIPVNSYITCEHGFTLNTLKYIKNLISENEWKMALLLFGDENFETIKVPSSTEKNNYHYIKITKNCQYKACYMSMYRGK